jgi:DNA polymerase III epsilon subunit-like protein
VTDQPICFIDTETTSLRHDRRAWEIAVILRRPGKPDHEAAWLIDYADLDLGNADPSSLKFGRFYDRHPGPGTTLFEESEVLQRVEQLTRGAILMGSNPGFDVEVLGARMRAHGICPSWHYHLEDVPTLALGWLYGAGRDIPEVRKSDQISLACGVDPADYDRHSALGDCRWIRDLFDAVTTGKAAVR